MLDKQKFIDVLQGGVADSAKKALELSGEHTNLQSKVDDTAKNVTVLNAENSILQKILNVIGSGSLDFVPEVKKVEAEEVKVPKKRGRKAK